MTALAWDGKTLAADTMYNQGGHKGYASKLAMVNHPIIGKMMVALSGTIRGSSLMIEQLEQNIVKQVDDYDVQSVYGIGVDSGRNVYSIHGDGYCLMDHKLNPFMAGGSCWEFLYGAMYAGASAERAIGLALEHRTDAGNDCQKLSWVEVFGELEDERLNRYIPF